MVVRAAIYIAGGLVILNVPTTFEWYEFVVGAVAGAIGEACYSLGKAERNP